MGKLWEEGSGCGSGKGSVRLIHLLMWLGILIWETTLFSLLVSWRVYVRGVSCPAVGTFVIN